MKKITELTEVRLRTIYTKDQYGNRERDAEEYIFSRPVKSISPGPRFVHFIIDVFSFQIILYLISYVFEIIGNATESNTILNLTTGLFSSIVFLLLYPALYTLSEFMWQKTPGKFITKTLVIDEYGNRPELRALILRSFVRIVPFEPFSCYGDKYSYGWHDKWSNTWVVTEEELAEIKKLQREQNGESH